MNKTPTLFFSVSTCDYDLTLKNSRLIAPIHQFFEFIAKRHPYTRILLKSPAKESHSFVAFGFGLGCQVSSNRMFEVWLGMNVVNDISMASFFWHIWRYLQYLLFVASDFDFQSKSSCITLGTILETIHLEPWGCVRSIHPPPKKKQKKHTKHRMSKTLRSTSPPKKSTTLSGSPNNLSAERQWFFRRVWHCFVSPASWWLHGMVNLHNSRHSAQLFLRFFVRIVIVRGLF